jgi:tRNA threonylcarbamoyl adenosine modification protein (Sua5/YciO/YrdC/YwlC family)
LYGLKSREAKPGTIIAATIDQLRELGADHIQLAVAKQWWPGPVSAVIVMHGNNYLHQNVGDVAMRVVDNPTLRTLLEQTGPLATTSANLPGQPPAATIEEAYAYFGESVDFYLDGGTIANVLPSTIIRPTSSGVEILRQGSVRIY